MNIPDAKIWQFYVVGLILLNEIKLKAVEPDSAIKQCIDYFCIFHFVGFVRKKLNGQK